MSVPRRVVILCLWDLYCCCFACCMCHRLRAMMQLAHLRAQKKATNIAASIAWLMMTRWNHWNHLVNIALQVYERECHHFIETFGSLQNSLSRRLPTAVATSFFGCNMTNKTYKIRTTKLLLTQPYFVICQNFPERSVMKKAHHQSLSTIPTSSQSFELCQGMLLMAIIA